MAPKGLRRGRPLPWHFKGPYGIISFLEVPETGHKETLPGNAIEDLMMNVLATKGKIP